MPRSGDLAFAHDGTPLMLLGIPRVDADMGRLFEGTWVVIPPDGRISLFLPDIVPKPGMRALLVPWETEWDPFPDDDHK